MNGNINEIYNKLEKIVENGIIEIINEKSPVYDEYDIVISNEQQFIKNKELDDKKIYIVIQYGQATVHHGQIIMPYTLVVLSEKNRLKIAQQLMYDYSINKDMSYSDDKTIYQIIDTPITSSNFQLLFEGYRSILQVSGSFIISETANFYGLIYHSEEIENLKDGVLLFNDELIFEIEDKEITVDKKWDINFVSNSTQYKTLFLTKEKEVFYISSFGNSATQVYGNKLWDENYKKIQITGGSQVNDKELIEWLINNGIFENEESLKKINEEVDFVTSSLKCDIVPDTQPFYFRKNFTDSINKFANLGFSIVIFNVSDSVLVDDILKIITKKSDINKTFDFTIRFLKNHSLTDKFKLISINADQEIGRMTMLVLTFIN